MDNTIYLHRTPSGKVYIGQTSRKPEKRWDYGRGYKQNEYFYNAIQKYGWNNIEHIILMSGVSDDKVNYWETYFINLYDSTNREKGYNLTSGGKENFKHNEVTKQKISKIKRGQTPWNKGVPMSEEQKQKLSKVHKGKHTGKRKPMSEEQKQKLSLAGKGNQNAKGKKRSPEQKQKLSKIKKGQIPWNKGVPMSEEQKQKLSKVHKGKTPWNKGKKLKLVDGKRVWY